MNARVKALLIDFFGTLAEVDDERSYLEDVAAGLSSVLGVSSDKSLEYFMEARRLANAVREASLAEITVDGQAALITALAGGDWRSVRAVLVNAMLNHLVPVDRSPEFLMWASSRFKTAIISNITCRCYVEEFLRRVGASMDVLVTSDVVRYRKPHRAMFRIALKRLGVRPEEAVMVGDDDVDLGARALGILTVVIGDKVRGDLNFSSLAEFTRWLEEAG
ncbi:MAG: haloacid dehalogenase [Thermoproteus sp. JCHS_4]|jgi:Predicted hydrolase (HAD superfamily)|nr:MAG: haloacid dehalogenase [Thermoproteus sp. JCHS_4]